MRYRVSTPVAGHTGAVGGVTFVGGQAVVDGETHASELAYCRGAGYGVEELVDGEPVVDEPPAAEPPAGEVPKKSASTEAWRTWAVAHGGMDPDQANAKSRDELVAQFTKENS